MYIYTWQIVKIQNLNKNITYTWHIVKNQNLELQRVISHPVDKTLNTINI